MSTNSVHTSTDTYECTAVDADARLYRKVVLRIIPFLFVCYLVNFIDRTNIGFAQLALKEELGFSSAIYGFGAGLFYLGYIAFEVPSNVLMQRIGARRTILRVMVLWGVLSMAMAVVKTPTAFYVVRFLLGAAEAGFMPGVLFYLSCWIPPVRRARVTALFMLAIPLSGVIGAPISGGLMHFMEQMWVLHGWQWMFLLEGFPAVVLGIAAYFVLADSPLHAKWLTDAERIIIADALRAESAVKGRGKHAGNWKSLLDRRLFLLALFCFAMNGSIAGFSFWLPTIVRSFGIDNALHIGLLVALPYALGAVTLFLNGRHSDKTQERRWHASATLVTAGVGWLLLPLAQHMPLVAMILITLATAGTLGTLAAFWPLVPLFFPTQRAIGFAAVSSIGSLGSLASPMIVGWIASRTGSVFTGTLYLGGIILVATAMLLWQTHKPSSTPGR
jgi:MFS family permease